MTGNKPYDEKYKLYRLNNDDPNFRLQKGDILACRPYRYDPEKVVVHYRLSDNYAPDCTAYKEDLKCLGFFTAVEFADYRGAT